jgi:subtilisin family serine protease
MHLIPRFSRALVHGFACALFSLATSVPVHAASGNDAELPGEVMVKLRSSAELTGLLQRYPVTLVSRFGARPIYRLKVIGAARAQDVMAQMALDTAVMLAESNPTARSPEARKNMPWAIGTATAYTAQWAPQAMRLGEAQRLSVGAGVRVAVLDTGIDRNHPLFAGRLLAGRDFVDDDNDPAEGGLPSDPSFGHGTHVAGLVALTAPGASIMPLRVLDAAGVGNAWVLAEALLHAVDPDGNPATDDGAHVINLSLGSLTRTRLLDTIAQIVACSPPVPDDPIGDRSDAGYADDEARCQGRTGALVLAAAGNDGSGSIKQYPAAEGAYGLVSVAATSSERKLAKFSNSGSWIDLAAPGEGITSAAPGGGWATWSGTSMASPLAAGVAALIRSAAPALAAKGLVQRLKRSASVICGVGFAQVDAYAAVADLRPNSGKCR